jgi:hypothetical protein
MPAFTTADPPTPVIGPEVRVVDQAPQVAFEMADVDRIEADERREQADIGFGDPLADQIALARQPRLEFIGGLEQRAHRLLIGVLQGREAGAIDAVVDRLEDLLVERIDLAAQRLRIEVRPARADAIERRVEHPDDLGRFVIDDRLPLAVPEHRHADPAGVVGPGAAVDLMQVARAVEAIAGRAAASAKLPAVLGHVPVDDRDINRVLETLELAHDQRAVRPGTGERDVEVIAPGRGRQPAFAGRSGTAVGGDPVAKLGLAADEASAAVCSVAALVAPDTFDQSSHPFAPPHQHLH